MKYRVFAVAFATAWFLQTRPTPLPTAAPTSSPGGKIAFVSTARGNSEIYAIDMTATTPKPIQITHEVVPHAQLGEPTFSPDGKQIAFTVFVPPGGWDIYGMNADGTNLVQLTYNGLENVDPAWSPDGKQMAFSCGVPNHSGEICAIASSGGTPLILTPHQAFELDKYAPAWSPDGKHIAFTWLSGMQWYVDVMNADGSQVSEVPPPQGDSTGGDPAWSPDGKQIAFAAINADGIYVMNVDGSNRIELTRHDHSDGPTLDGQEVAWSPDGEHILFNSPTFSGAPDSTDIYVVNPDGSHLLKLTNGKAFNQSPAWSPDGRQIAFISTEDGDGDIYVMNVDGSGLRRLTTGLAPVSTDRLVSAPTNLHPDLAWSSR